MLDPRRPAEERSYPVEAIKVASNAVKALSPDRIRPGLKNVRSNPDILLYTRGDPLKIQEEKTDDTDQTLALNVDDSLRRVVNVQRDPSLAGMATSVVGAASNEADRDLFNGSFLYGTFDVNNGDRKHFFGKVLQVNTDSIFWSPYFTVTSFFDEDDDKRLFDLEDNGNVGLWTDSRNSGRTVVVLSQPKSDSGKTAYDPMLDNESIGKNLGIQNVRTNVIPKQFHEKILSTISSDHLKRRKEMRGDPSNFSEWIVLRFLSDDASEFSFDLSALFAMIATKDPVKARLSNVQLNADESLPFAERLPSGLLNLLRSDSMVAVGYKTGVANTYDVYRPGDEEGRKRFAKMGVDINEGVREDEGGNRRVFVNTAVPFIGRPVRYIQSGTEPLDIGRTIVSRPLIFTAPSTYKVLQGKSGYLDSAYVNLPNVNYEIRVRFHPRMFGMDDGRTEAEDVKPIAEALRAIQSATTKEKRDEGFSALWSRMRKFDRFLSKNEKSQNVTVLLRFPAVEHVVYNEFSMLGDEESLYEQHASAETFVRQGRDGPLNPLFRMDPRLSVDKDSTTPRVNIEKGIPDGDRIPLSTDGKTVHQDSRYGSMALRESVLRLVRDVNQIKESRRRTTYTQASLIDQNNIDLTEKLNTVKVSTHWDADSPGDPSFKVFYTGGSSGGVELNQMVMKCNLDLTEMANLVRTNSRDADAVRSTLSAFDNILSALCALEHPGDDMEQASFSAVGTLYPLSRSDGIYLLKEHFVNTHALIELFSLSYGQLQGIKSGPEVRVSGRAEPTKSDRQAVEDARQRIKARIDSNDNSTEGDFAPDASVEGEVTHHSIFVRRYQEEARSGWREYIPSNSTFSEEMYVAMESKTLPKTEPKTDQVDPVVVPEEPFAPPDEDEDGDEDEDDDAPGTPPATSPPGTPPATSPSETDEEDDDEISFDWDPDNDEDEPAPTPPPLSNLGAYSGVDMFMYTGRFIMRGIVTTVVRIKGRKGVPAIQYGGPFIRDIAEMNRRLRFTTGGIGRVTYAGGMGISFCTVDEFRENPNNPEPVSAFAVDGGFVERIMDVGGRFHRVNDSLAVVGATFNPSDGRVIHSTAKTTSIGRKQTNSMNAIPQAGIIVVYGNVRGVGRVAAAMDYSFIPTTNGRRGEVEERILSLQLRDGRGKLRQVALVHIRAQLRVSSPTCRVHSILFGLNKKRAVANSLGNAAFGKIERGLPPFEPPEVKVTPTIRTTGGPGEGTAGPFPTKPDRVLKPIQIPVNVFPSANEVEKLTYSAFALKNIIIDLLTILGLDEYGEDELQNQLEIAEEAYVSLTNEDITEFIGGARRFEDTYKDTYNVENPYPIRESETFVGETKEAYDNALGLWVGLVSDTISNAQTQLGKVEDFYNKEVVKLQRENPALNTVPGLSFNDIVLSPYNIEGTVSPKDRFLLFDILKNSVGTKNLDQLEEENLTTPAGLKLDAERLPQPVSTGYYTGTETLYYFVSHDLEPTYIYDPKNLKGPLRLERDPASANFNTFVRIGNGRIFKTVPKVGQIYVSDLLLRSAEEDRLWASVAAQIIIEGTETTEPVKLRMTATMLEDGRTVFRPRAKIIVKLFEKEVYVDTKTREIQLPTEARNEEGNVGKNIFKTGILYEGYAGEFFATGEEVFKRARDIIARRGEPAPAQAKITGTSEGNGALLEHAEDFHGMEEEGEEVGGNGEGGETIEDIYKDYEDYEDYEEYPGEDEDWDNL